MKVSCCNAVLPFAILGVALIGLKDPALAQTSSDPPVVTILATDHHAAEAETDAGVFTVNRSGPTQGSLLVFYELSGTARNGVDYQELPNTVTIPAGAGSATISIKPINDTLVEGTETVIATLVASPTLSPIEPYRVGFPSSDIILLADNDSPPTNPPPVVHLLSPTNGAMFTAPANITLVANATIFGDVAKMEFFAGTDNLGEGTFEPSKCAFCPVWILNWTNVPPGEYTLTARATDVFGRTSTSDAVRVFVKSAPIVTIEATDPIATEIAEVPPGMGMVQRSDPATFTVRRSGSTSESLEVHYRIEGTARNGLDYFDADAPYAELRGIVTIPAGSVSTTITIFPIDDGEVEDTETVVLTLVPKDCDPTVATPICYLVGEQSRATAFIKDNDTTPHLPPTVKIVSPTNGAQFTAPAEIVLTALAHAEGAWVRMVEFFAGDRNLGVVQFDGFMDAFRLTWRDVPAGEYTLTARATDSVGARSVSDPVHIVVRSPGDAPLVLVPGGATWKYLDNGSDQGTVWHEPGFNDTEWKSGPAQLGFGDGDEATVLRRGDGDRGFITYYFRRAFEVSTVEGISALTLRLLRDDGAVVYLNDHEVFRSNMPDGPITFNTLAAQTIGPDTENLFLSAFIDPHLLVSGRNVLAVEVHQVSVTSSDVSFDLELIAGGARNIPVVNIEVTDAEAAEISPLLGVPPNPAVFSVTRSGETNKALKVSYRLAGTARNGIDYQLLPNVVIFQPGESSVEIVVLPIDDTLVEGTESVVPILLPGMNPAAPYIVGPKASAEAHIRDNDAPPPNTLPLVKIVRPENGAGFNAPATILIVAEVRDPDGWVGLVEFFANERKIGEQSVAFVREPDPGQTQVFSFEWKDVPPGEYTLVANATDNRDGRGVSEPVRVNVRECGIEISLLPRDTGTISYWPELGRLDFAGNSDSIQSVYSKTTSENREFRRGFLEFAIPEITSELVRATLLLTTGESGSSTPQPTVRHQLSWYAADLIVGTNDYQRAAMPLAVLETDADQAHQTFQIDVSHLVNEFRGGKLGFRIKLAVDPEFNEIADFGATFVSHELGTQPTNHYARLLIVTCPQRPPAPPVVTVVARDAYAREGTNDVGEVNTAAFVVRRTGETNSDLTVFYSLHGTAENGKDYETLPASVIIPADRHTARVVVRPIDDELKECIETVLLRLEPDPSLGPVARYAVGWPNKAAAIIVDNDHPRPDCVRLPDGLFHLCLPGNNGFGFRLECSTDLNQWTPLCTNVVTDGAVHFVDPDANGDQHRFYRVVSESVIELDD
jgi:hypothetical protein